MVQRSLVSVVDDDESVRESLPDLLRQFGFAAQAFSSAEAFLASEFVSQTNCLILDIAIAGLACPHLTWRPQRPSAPVGVGGLSVSVQAVQRRGVARSPYRGFEMRSSWER